jgi:hypothetical protein
MDLPIGAIGEFAEDDELTGMALGVFGDVGEENAERRFQTLAADVAGGFEVLGVLGEVVGGFVGCFDFCD